MGKIRLKTIGDEGLEQEEKKKKDIKRAEKKAREAHETKEEATEEISEPQTDAPAPQAEASAEKAEEKKEPKKKQKQGKARERSQKYHDAKAKVEEKPYNLDEALKLLRDTHLASFDETVELHINTLTTGVSGSVALPYGSGKEVKVAIATDALIAEIEKGKVDFDILVAQPDMMPKLAKVARVLGPRGLMPNPKSGTITDKPETLVEKFKKGQVNFKTEAKAPIIHMAVGKLSFDDGKLKENIEVAIGAVRKSNIRDITLKSTMSPGIKLTA
jgi:large subunit ribosomal protein L1